MSLIKKIKTFNLQWVLGALIISVTWVNFNLVRWNLKDVISSDVNHYYSYLPAFFIEHDLSLSFLDDNINNETEAKHYAPNKTPKGQYVIKMSMGAAFGYLPFFGMAHVYAQVLGYKADGFSEPYHFAVLFSSLFWFVLGLVFLGKLLRLYFPSFITTFTVFCICFGTNVFYYLTIAGGMPHAFSFALVAMFIYYTISWHQHHELRAALILGLLCAMLVLVRPVNLLLLLFFLFYNVNSRIGFIQKFRLLTAHKWQVLAMAGLAFLICLPQLCYWHYVSGSYFFHSYVGEHFFFLRPHLADGLFSFRKGWLLYTPMMLFAVAGLFFLKNSLRQYAFAIPVFLVVYLYVIFSWWCWWYGGSFGQRAMIDVYPLLAIPMATFIYRIRKKDSRLKKLLYTLAGIFIVLNLFQTMQAKYNILHYDSMTRESYFRNFFSTSKSADREKYLDHPDYDAARRGLE